MEVWYAIPSANPEKCQRAFQAWQAMGYRTMVLLDEGMPEVPAADKILYTKDYQGWPKALGQLCREVDSDIVVTGGDDMFPDPYVVAEEIGWQFQDAYPDLFGVMQPTGDDWMKDKFGHPAAARICGSPWLGRKVIDELNEGRGVFWPEYFHFFADEELYEVTTKLRILWQRSDLNHYHDHWSRQRRQRPVYLNKARDHWDIDKALFNTRRAAGFPHHQPKVK